MFAKEIKKRITKNAALVVILTVILFMGNGMITGLALENNKVSTLEAGRTGTLTVGYQSRKAGKVIPLRDVEFRICRVSDLTVNHGVAEYKLLDELSQTQISFEDMNASASNEAAHRLYKFVKKNGIYMRSGKTDASGYATFGGLQPGMYLVVQPEKHRQDDNYYESEPFLVSVPAFMDGGNGRITWDYSVEAFPKHSSGVPIEKITPPHPPKTGDLLLIGFWGCVLIICSIGMRAVFAERKSGIHN